MKEKNVQDNPGSCGYQSFPVKNTVETF